MLRKRIVATCEKITIEGIDTVSVFLLGNPKYPLPFLIKKKILELGEIKQLKVLFTNYQVLVFQKKIHLPY